MCNNPCCNPETCMFYVNATCATGKCCDLDVKYTLLIYIFNKYSIC